MDKLPYSDLPTDENGVVQLEGPDFLIGVTGKRQFTVIGNTHTIEELELLAQKKVIDGFAGKNVTRRYMEIPEGHQRFVDAYDHGNATATDAQGNTLLIDEDYMFRHFKDAFKHSAYYGNDVDRAARTFSDTLKYAKENGIKVRFYDKNPEAYEKYPEMRRIRSEHLRIQDEQGQTQARAYLNQLPNDTKRQYQEFIKAFVEERNNENYRIAKDIKADAGTEYAVIDIGGGHIERKPWLLWNKDLDEFLGEDSTTTIQLFSSANDPYYRDFYDKDLDTPDFFYFVKEGKGAIPPKEYDPSILDKSAGFFDVKRDVQLSH